MQGTDAEGRRQIRLSRDVFAGCFLIAIGAFAYFSARGLSLDDSSGVGPGLLPRSVSAIIVFFGLLILALGLGPVRDRLGRWSWRGPIFVLGAVVVFAATIRTLGLAFAGPLAVLISAFADPDSKPFEIVIFALVMSALCVGLFKYLLRLPIPLAPLVLGY